MKLRDKIALITGAGNGIGAATARRFADDGAALVLADIDLKAAETVALELRARGGRALPLHLDVCDEDAVAAGFDKAEEDFGSIDILVNNAGIVEDARLVNMTSEVWQRVVDVNLKGVFLCGREAARRMTPRGHGVILNAASVVALYGNFGQSGYVAAKSGVIGMTRTWSRELGKHQIRVNAVAPGFIHTRMVDAIPEKVVSRMVEKTPLGKMGRPEDVAAAYAFLASDEAAFVTGAVLSVDGGLVV